MATLVTGGAGFIGAEVVNILVEQGEKPFIFSRNPSLNRLGNVADHVEVIRGDVGNFSNVLDAVKKVKPDVIYHFGAALSLPSEANPPSSMQTNAMGTFHVLEAAKLFDVKQVIFASSIGVYGLDVQEDVITDVTLQRPILFYGITKVFGEHLGLFYKRKYGVDFRSLRFPSIIGPGVDSPGALQFTSWVIEESAKGNPFTVNVEPRTRAPVMYIKDAGLSAVRLAEAPVDTIKTVNYNINGIMPTPSIGEIAEEVKRRIPDARISFEPDMALQRLIDDSIKPIDDSNTRTEWNWQPQYNLERTVDDFLTELG